MTEADTPHAAVATFDVNRGIRLVANFTEDRPLLLHAVNLQTYRTPLAAGPGGQLPDLSAFRRLVAAAADTAFGRGRVRHIAITQARPA